jgi:hypothetical protein
MRSWTRPLLFVVRKRSNKTIEQHRTRSIVRITIIHWHVLIPTSVSFLGRRHSLISRLIRKRTAMLIMVHVHQTSIAINEIITIAIIIFHCLPTCIQMINRILMEIRITNSFGIHRIKNDEYQQQQQQQQ